MPAIFSKCMFRCVAAMMGMAASTWPAVPAQAAGSGNYPDKPIALIVSYPAGDSVDVAARILQEPLRRALGQPVQEAFVAQGAVAVGGTPAELEAVVKTEVPMWKSLAKEANISVK